MLRKWYDWECKLFYSINRYFDQKWLNTYFRSITHVGGATFSITSVMLAIWLLRDEWRDTAIASAIALALSHIPVTMMKKIYPRKRPYISLHKTKVTKNPLTDHSFPSGHTTAIFSVIVPFLLYAPALAVCLLPIAVSVAVSRIYLGLHYPSDVLAGCMLGTLFGIASFSVLT